MMQSLLGYTALDSGLVGIPRGAGTVIAILVVTRLIAWLDARILLIIGLVVTAVSMMMQARMDLFVDERALMIAGFVQGVGGGLMFVPLTVIICAAMYALTRNIGQSIGISLLQRELIHYTAGSRALLVEGIRPDNPAIAFARPDLDFGSAQAMASLSREIGLQAAMVGNVQAFWLVFFASVAMIPLVLLMRNSGNRPRPETLPLE